MDNIRYEEIEIRTYLKHLFAVHDPGLTEITTFHETGFFDNEDDATDFIIRSCMEGRNVYYGVQPRDRDLIESNLHLAPRVNRPGPGDRGKSSEVPLAMFIALDFDTIRTGGENDDNKINATDEELEALKLAVDSIAAKYVNAGVVASGNGFHVLLRHDAVPYCDEYLRGVKAWSEQLEREMKFRFRSMGLDFPGVRDNISDPPRVLRMPGTLNVKYSDDSYLGRPRRLAQIENKWRDIEPGLTDKLLALGSNPKPSKSEIESVDLSQHKLTSVPIPEAGEYPAKVKNRLKFNNAGKLAKTLNGNRSDLDKGTDENGEPIRDRSQYDIATAGCCVRLNLSPEDIVKTMLANPYGKARIEWQAGRKNYVLHKIEDAFKRWQAMKATAELDDPELPPSSVAERFVAEMYPVNHTCNTLICMKKQYYEFNDQAWEELSEEMLESSVNKLLRSTVFAPKAGMPFQSYVMKNIRGLTTVPIIENNTWIDDSGKGTMINVANGLLNVERLIAKDPLALEEHNANYFSQLALPFPFDLDAVCPRWIEFLEQALPDKDTRRMLQQLFGLALVPDTSFQRFWILYGPPSTGKSVACFILTELLGEGNVSNVSLDMLGEKHTGVMLQNKLVNIASEIEQDSIRTNEKIIKAISGEDRMTMNPKFKDLFTEKLSARLIFASNTLPRFRDRSHAVDRRLTIIPMDQIVAPEDRDRSLRSHLKENEMPGILNWSIEGLRDLYTSNEIFESVQSLKVKEQHLEDSHLFETWIKENLEFDASFSNEIECMDVYRAMKGYFEACGHQPLNNSNFGKMIFNVFTKVKKIRKTTHGRRKYFYAGLKWRDDTPPDAGAVPLGF